VRFTLPLDADRALAVRLDDPEVSHGESSGDGTVMLYLHGFGSSQAGEKADLFRARCVARGIAFCSFDFRGHGDSGGSMLRLSLSRNLSDTATVHDELERRGYSRILLFGSSMGGLTGLWHAHRHPERIAAAIHLAPALGLERTFTASLGAEKMARWQRDGKLEIEHELGTWDLGWDFVEDLRRHHVGELAAGYETPTLIFQSKHDTSVPWRAVVDFATQATGEEIELHLFADGDHRLIDRLPRLWALAEEFLEGRGLLLV
jgi:alpha-beta hydrolase superfamily lysophospholipase